MRNVMKAATLESKFPILAVEHDCIISKNTDCLCLWLWKLRSLYGE